MTATIGQIRDDLRREILGRDDIEGWDGSHSSYWHALIEAVDDDYYLARSVTVYPDLCQVPPWKWLGGMG